MTFSLYLTGVPAVGKSTLASAIATKARAARFSYGEILTEALKGQVGSQVALRERSAEVITPANVRAADLLIRNELLRLRGVQSAVVDSHALTAENYGLRAVPYSWAEVVLYPYTHIVCLTAPDGVISDRLRTSSEGRRVQDSFDMSLHQGLQSSLALGYAAALGVPIAFIRADRERNLVLADVLAFVGHDE